MKLSKPVYIVSAKRTPIGSFLGSLSSFSAPKLGSMAIEGALKDAGVAPEKVESVFMGNVLTGGVGQAPARQAALGAGIPNSVPCVTLNKVCGSGLESIIQGIRQILLGEKELVVAGGQESMSQAPHLLPRLRTGLRLGDGALVDSMINDGLWDPYKNIHMGSCAELCAKEKSFSREQQDAYSIESFKRAQKSVSEKLFASEMTSVSVKDRKGNVTEIADDEGPFKAKFDKIPGLKPVFEKDGTITAANASTINDGASAMVLASEEMVNTLKLTPLAKIEGYSSHAHAPEWFTTAPVTAMENLLKDLSWEVPSVDAWEVNEAFAVVTLAAMKDLGLSHEKTNIRGGAIALGHPIGASGNRIVTTLAHLLKQTGKKRGVAGICIGGGEALSLGIETL